MPVTSTTKHSPANALDSSALPSIAYMSYEDVLIRSGYESLVEHLREAHRETSSEIGDWVMNQAGTDNSFLLRAAWNENSSLGVKLSTVFPENLKNPDGPPSVQGMYMLFDGKDGRPLACIDGTALTYIKTSADSALGSKLLSREDSKTLLMVGAGGMAQHLIDAHTEVRESIERVLIWNRTKDRAEKLIEDCYTDIDDLSVEVADDLEQAVREADIISCATMTKEPLVKGEWLSPGTHLDLVGSYRTDMRETDDAAMKKGRVFVDTYWGTVPHCGDISAPLESGVLTEDTILGDLFELCQETVKGRQSQDEITIFKNGGGGHLDLMTANYLSQ